MTKNDHVEIVMTDMGIIHPTDLQIELAHSCFEMAYESFCTHGDPLRLFIDTDVLYNVMMLTR